MFTGFHEPNVGTWFGNGNAALCNARQHKTMPLEIMAVTLMDIQQYLSVPSKLGQVGAVDHIWTLCSDRASTQPGSVQETLVISECWRQFCQSPTASVIQRASKQDIIWSIGEICGKENIMQKKVQAHLILTLVSIIYGANYVIIKLVSPQFMGPSGLVLIRTLMAVVFFWVMGMFVKKQEIF